MRPSRRSRPVLTATLTCGLLAQSALEGCGATRHPLDSSRPWEWATRAYEHPATRIPVEVPKAVLPPLPETIPDALNERVTLRSDAIDIRSLMLGLARQTGLNITLDPDLTGQVTAYFNDVTVIEALRNIAEQLAAEIEIKNNVVAVHRPRNEYRMFRLQYLRNPRVGMMNFGNVDRTLTYTGSTSAPITNSPAMPKSLNLGSIQIPAMPAGGGSAIQLASTFGSDFWEDLDSELMSIVFEGDRPDEMTLRDRFFAGVSASDQSGRSLIVDTMSGTIMARARRQVLDAIADYLDAVNKTIQRQVVIEVQMLEVSMSDETLFGINGSGLPVLPSSVLNSLASITNSQGGLVSQGTTSTLLSAQSLGASITTPMGFPNVGGTLNASEAAGAVLPLNPSEAVYAFQLYNDQTLTTGNKFPFQVLVQALGQLGDVRFVSAPRLTALHNQKAILKVVTDRVYWLVSGGSVTPATATSAEVVSAPTITPLIVPEGVTLDVTPVIGDDGSITLDIHPSFAVIVDSSAEPGGNGGSEPEVERREFDTTVRVEGEKTVLLGGMVSEHSQRTETGLPFLKDIPYLGALFRNTDDLTTKDELLILLTPHIQGATVLKQEINELRALEGQDPVKDQGSNKGK